MVFVFPDIFFSVSVKLHHCGFVILFTFDVSIISNMRILFCRDNPFLCEVLSSLIRMLYVALYKFSFMDSLGQKLATKLRLRQK